MADLPQLRELAIRVFTITFEHNNNPADFNAYITDAYAFDKMRAEFDEPNAIYWVAVAGETFAGYARVRENNEVDNLLGNNHLELQRIYVDAPFQGQGIAQALLTVCEEEARSRNKMWIWLGVWEHNPKAIHFYQKHGYERFSEHTFVMGSDEQTDFLMRKLVNSKK